MKLSLYLFLVIFAPFYVNAQSHKLQFNTNSGSFKVVLYDFTPKHQDLILSAVKNRVYHTALFNRIIENFVVQGGEHDDDISAREQKLSKEKRYRLQPEFDNRAFHKIGALGAGRDDNSSKSSFLNQIYFVVGKKVTDEELDQLEAIKGITFSKSQREIYLKDGGLPRLDNDYTIFGEVYEGLEVLMDISKVETDVNDAPILPIVFNIVEIE